MLTSLKEYMAEHDAVEEYEDFEDEDQDEDWD
jgi:hypothetical protein